LYANQANAHKDILTITEGVCLYYQHTDYLLITHGLHCTCQWCNRDI